MIYGLITDENIENYCLGKRKDGTERNIPFFKKEPIERVINGERTNKSVFGNDGLINKHDLIKIVKQGKDQLEVNDDETNIFVVGSGCYHHVTYGILQNQGIDSEFDIISFDHHTDLNHLIEEEVIVKCGTHKSASLRDIPHLKKVSVISYKQGKFILNHSDDYQIKEKVQDFTEDGENKDLKDTLKQSPRTYLTIDIDVLNYPCGIKEYETYTQGNMPVHTFFELLEWILENKDIIGMDICGLTPDNRSSMIYDKILERSSNLF